MLEALKTELDSVMNRYSNDLDSISQEKAEARKAEEEFSQEFQKLKESVIWPSIVEVGNELNQYGHDYHVSEEKEYMDSTAHFHPASITFNIYPAVLDKALYKPESTPYVSFIADRYARKIRIMVSTMMPGAGGVVGAHGEYDTAQITQEFVEKEIVEVLKSSLIFHKAE